MAVRIELRRDAGKIDPRRVRWIRRRQVARVLGPPDPSALACVVDHRDRILGHGLYSPDSSILVRLICAGEAPPPADWFERRLAAALARRARLGLGQGESSETTGYRELNSEGDGVPGLVLDRFADWRVIQITTAAIDARAEALLAWLRSEAPVAGGQIVLRPEAAATREGFVAGARVESGGPSGGEIAGPERLHWRERGLRFEAPAPPAQKTGAYHDQRDNRAHFAALACAGIGADRPRVLDLGCHVGGFALAAAARGAEVVAVDQSTRALEYVARNAALNGLEARVTAVAADMFGPLEDPALAGPFDALIFDPPKIASSQRDVGRATRAMTRSLRALIGRVTEGGLVGLCSCSHHLGWSALDTVMLDASPGATRVARWGPGVDHPVAPGHEQGEYLRVAVYTHHRR